MAELNGYLLTKEEEKACVELIKKMRFGNSEKPIDKLKRIVYTIITENERR